MRPATLAMLALATLIVTLPAEAEATNFVRRGLFGRRVAVVEPVVRVRRVRAVAVAPVVQQKVFVRQAHVPVVQQRVVQQRVLVQQAHHVPVVQQRVVVRAVAAHGCGNAILGLGY